MQRMIGLLLASSLFIFFAMAGPARAEGEGRVSALEKKAEIRDAKKKGDVKGAHGATPSKIKASKTQAALKLVVVDKDKGPIEGVTISLTGSKDQKKLYAAPTDSTGYTELLLPIGQDYEIVYLDLGFTETAATMPIEDKPNQTIRLTLRYKKYRPKLIDGGSGVILVGINFDSGKAVIKEESFGRLDLVAEYMLHKPGVKVEISGHTDSVGKQSDNKALSQKRAEACVKYLVGRGVPKEQLSAKGYGSEKPVASNGTAEGREQNRRIEAREM